MLMTAKTGTPLDRLDSRPPGGIRCRVDHAPPTRPPEPCTE